MSRTACPPAALGPEVAAALLEAFAALRKLLAHPDPKVSLRAAAELTRLVGVVARHKLTLEPIGTVSPTPLPATPMASPTSPSRGEVFSAPPPLRGRSLEPKVPAGGGFTPPSRPVSLGGPPLTSFLGKLPTAGKPPGRVNSA